VRFGDVIYKFLGGSNVESSYHEEIYRLTILDGLTGVHNKRYFLEFLAREVAVVHRYGHPLTLVLLDVDHFKAINDKWGHLAGDAVLKDYAYRVGTRIRREDLFARCGGEEFACVLPSTALTGGVVFAEALRRLASDRPTVFGTEPIPFTVSLGVASMDGASGGDVTDLLKRADDNMYAAKRAGRNRVVP
jgi:diguanylate cyclase (GGDEF)-like protein